MNDDDLIVVVPWLIFAVGLAVIGWRLAAGRLHGRRHRGAASPGRPGSQGRPGAPGA